MNITLDFEKESPLIHIDTFVHEPDMGIGVVVNINIMNGPNNLELNLNRDSARELCDELEKFFDRY